MSGLFGSNKTPPPPPPMETPMAPVVDQVNIDRERSDMLKRRKGRAATVLASPLGSAGAEAPAASVATKSLLGQ